MSHTDFRVYLSERRALIDEALAALVPSDALEPRKVHAAMRHAVLGNGKRLRPVLSLAVGDLAGLPLERTIPCACAIEFIHTASLILDDLPCMDNAAERRGRPCVHVVFGEATALLAVMGLVALAFGTAAREGGSEIAACLARSMGTVGLVAGQQADLTLTGHGASIDAIEEVHNLKSGALFIAAVHAPALLAGMGCDETNALDVYARQLGLAFQITDDLLDAGTGHEDAGKDTFVSQLGVNGARTRVKELIASAVGALEHWGTDAEPLRMMADYVGARSQ